ncbi:hypothetical protein [Clostridium brassicae]|uniref:Uncharacterized protein n=1 Tax=Clostridium brassicae TaxID=2999072 RepID=A0ABT4D6B8_9CLOT|nr:hypothetical protein [Clostridium brassicae]MCY6957850.1 hypothetical protein [Clostridium brassicae]
MKNYTVSVPISGWVCVSVEANNEDEAISKAFEEATLEDLEEWEMHKCIVEGNVFHGLMNEIDIFKED